MKKLFYLTAMAFFFAMSVSFSPPDSIQDAEDPEIEYVIHADQNADVSVSFQDVQEVLISLHSEGGTTEESLSKRLFVPQSDGDSPDRNLINDVGDGASKESNYNSNHEVRSDRPIDPGWCSSK